MDILNFISWIRGGRQVTTVDPAKTLLPVGLKDGRRDDDYLAGAISVTDFAAQVGGLQTVAVDGVTITGDGTPGDPLVAATPAAPYKVYTAIISQSGTNNPTVVAVLQNNIGTITITRDTQGVYNFASPSFNSFSSNNKVFVSITNGQSTTGLYRGQYVPPISTVQITTLNTSNTATDGLLDNASIEIRLYL